MDKKATEEMMDKYFVTVLKLSFQVFVLDWKAYFSDNFDEDDVCLELYVSFHQHCLTKRSHVP